MSQQERAKESSQVRRARRKLRKRMKEEEENITPATLLKVMASIQRWLERHSSERISLKDRNIAKFEDDGKTAAFSESVKQLKKQLLEKTHPPHSLVGRVQKGFSSDK